MKINSRNIKKHSRKIRNATEEELSNLQAEYDKLMQNVSNASEPALLILSVLGVAIILLFDWGIIDFIGLLILIYPLYLFARNEGHQEGYYEGYYENMSKNGGASEHGRSNGSGHRHV